VLALFVVWESPVPVMVVSLLALAGWRLRVVPYSATEVVNDNVVTENVVTENVVTENGVNSGAGSTTTVRDAGTSTNGQRSGWRAMPVGPVAALGVVALLPGQAAVLQVAAADDSFARFAVLGTSFALGAIGGNLWLQRAVVRHRGIGAAYLLTAFSVSWALVEPVSAFALYGVSMACYYQLTRVIVVEAADPSERGRVSAAMTAVSKVCGVGGSVVAAAAVGHPVLLHLGGGAVALVAAASVGVGARLSPTPVPAAHRV